jgi:hypothetical protein
MNEKGVQKRGVSHAPAIGEKSEEEKVKKDGEGEVPLLPRVLLKRERKEGNGE